MLEGATTSFSFSNRPWSWLKLRMKFVLNENFHFMVRESIHWFKLIYEWGWRFNVSSDSSTVPFGLCHRSFICCRATFRQNTISQWECLIDLCTISHQSNTKLMTADDECTHEPQSQENVLCWMHCHSWWCHIQLDQWRHFWNDVSVNVSLTAIMFTEWANLSQTICCKSPKILQNSFDMSCHVFCMLL